VKPGDWVIWGALAALLWFGTRPRKIAEQVKAAGGQPGQPPAMQAGPRALAWMERGA
jgi:hypothetical protein